MRRRRLRDGSGGLFLGLHLTIWRDVLQSIDDHPFAWLKPRKDDAPPADLLAETDLAIGNLVVAADHIDKFLVLVVADGAFRDQQNFVFRATAQSDGNEHARHQTGVLIVESRTSANRARRRVDPV